MKNHSDPMIDRFIKEARGDEYAQPLILSGNEGLDIVKIQRLYESKVTWKESGDVVIDLSDGDRVTVERTEEGLTVASDKSKAEAFNLSLQTAKFQKVLDDLEALDAKLRGDEDA